jgi:allantoinase
VSEADLIVRHGWVVTTAGVIRADVAVTGGTITAVGPDLHWSAPDEIDATGLHVFPGGIDSHVHFNEPGRTEWETIADGSAALAAGGYTSFVDMPLNSRPVTVDGSAFDAKLEAARASSLVDFALWGGLVPDNLDRLDELVARGVVGFKAFMCPSGVDEFPACDGQALREGMLRIAKLDSILLVHAEDPLGLRDPSGTGARDFILSRPAKAELDAISGAIALAAETGCRLHVVHVSTLRGFELIQQARGRGIDVSGETCPHYLLYAEDDLERLGGRGKCAPPFRTTADRFGLWQKLTAGELPMVVSDHSPSTLELKQGDDFFGIWGGISGCQSTRQLLLARSLGIPTVAAVTATNIARRFGLKGKGEVAVGFDADLWLVDLTQTDVVRAQDLLYRNPFSAHEGQAIRGRTVRTLVRGRTVYAGGKPATERAGRPMRAGARS